MTMENVPIGEAARQSGVKAPTIRFYEQIGLLPAPPRSEGNRRQYNGNDLRRLTFIRHARELGFEIDAIRAPCWRCKIGPASRARRRMRLPAPGWRRWSCALPASRR